MLRLVDVSKSYWRGKKEIPVLQNCHLEVMEGEFLVIMGPSGSGKSTLLNLIGGIDLPNTGEILIENHCINTMNDNELTLFRRDHIGVIFQFFNLLPTLNAVENVALPLLLKGLSYQSAVKSASDILDLVHLDFKKDHKPEELSGGEMQRVAIARALISKPSIILADEPTGNLDSKTSEEIISLLKKFSQELNQTIIFVTHNDELAHIGHKLVNVKDGKLLA